AHVSESNQIDLKDPARRWTIVVRPAGMNARVATDQLAVVHGQSMGIRGAGKEVHDFEHLAAGGFVSYQTGPVIGIARAVIAHDLPNRTVIPGDAVITHPAGRLVERYQ